MILLTPHEIYKAMKDADEPQTLDLNAGHRVAKEQLRNVVEVLKDKTVKAWGGNRVILSEDWEAILKEVD